MEELIPGKKLFTSRDEAGQITWQRVAPGLDWTAKVVCKRCNETWMSDIENQHAKPAMADLILGKADTTISRSQAHSIAVFAFKTAVVVDHLKRDRQPFFVRATRHRFRESLAVPPSVGMWLAGLLPTPVMTQVLTTENCRLPYNSSPCPKAIGPARTPLNAAPLPWPALIVEGPPAVCVYT